jgi:hypothetical protein
MKNPFEPSTLVIGCSLVAILITAGWSLHEKSVLSEVALQRDLSVQAFEHLSSLKSRWGNSPDIQRQTAFLLAHPSLIRQERRQKSLFLEYDNLSSNEFDKIVSTLMNTPFIITKFELTRRMNVGTIRVEIEQ